MRTSLWVFKPAQTSVLIFLSGFFLCANGLQSASAKPPNILIAISDDQSWPHASAYGTKAIQTPAFDRIAREGVLFRNAFAASPGCSPSRAALLTGRHPWQLEEAGTHASSFPSRYIVFPDLLEESGYVVGATGKGWGPGNWKISGRKRNPAGPGFDRLQNSPPFRAMSNNDYAGNFREFLEKRSKDRPFYFWYGASEPHRAFEKGAGIKAGKRIEQVEVPPFLPDTPEIRSDLLDYYVEIEWFDQHLGRMIQALEEAGEIENTLIIVTSDNGMPFPRAKANCYEHGIHVPLAIRWGAKVPGGRTVEDLVGFVDLTATILEAAGARLPEEFPISGRSFMDLLTSTKQGVADPGRDAAWASRERHSSSRYHNWTYPQRALRTPQFLYIRNFKPERWPAGDPQKFDSTDQLGPMHGGYHDIDACPTLDFLIARRDDPVIRKYFLLAVDKRPAEELFDITRDPACLRNLADDPAFARIKQQLARRMDEYLQKTGDPRVSGLGDVWETYPRYSPIRAFPPPPERLELP
jgi:N-sulfoglucosamine sulfohydrolase